MANNQNLKPFNKGYDPRRGSKPKGSKHISSHIRELLEEGVIEYKLPDGTFARSTPMKAILNVLVNKAVGGDLRAIDLLAKHGYGNMIDLTVNERPVPEITPEQADQLLRLRASRMNRLDEDKQKD